MTGSVRQREAVIAVIGLIVAILVAIMLAGANPATVLSQMLERAVFTSTGLREALIRAIPFTLLGLGIAVAFRARIFNIGADGQLVAGAALAVACALVLPANPLGLLLFLLSGLVGGAVWGGIAGGLKARFGSNEIIVTIMLNYVALQLLSWLIRGPMQEAMGILPRTDAIDAALRLPVLVSGTRIHAGLLVALAAVVTIAFLMSRTRFGFKLSVVGSNPDAAVYAGLKPAMVAFLALTLSGGLAGLAGAVEIAGLYGRLQEGFAPGFGITAIAVALVARLNPWLVPVSAFGFSLLYVGLGAVARGGLVPFPLVHIIEGAIVLMFLAGSLAVNEHWRAKAERGL
jgi:general nucleoside transport system permease protein